MKKMGHQSTDKFGRLPDFEPVPRTDYEPTEFEPGSLEKIEVMRLRATLGLPIMHPLDKQNYDGVTITTARSSKKTEAAFGRRVRLSPRFYGTRKVLAE